MVASEHLDSISHWSGFEVGFNFKNHLACEISIKWFLSREKVHSFLSKIRGRSYPPVFFKSKMKYDMFVLICFL
jgi:hypothetical protein